MSNIRQLLFKTNTEKNISIEGWVQTARKAKAMVFLEVGDGSSIKNLQVVVPDTLPNYDEILKITTGCAVCVEGDLVESCAKGQTMEVLASVVNIVGWASSDYPLQKKRHSFEFLRTIAHVRPRAKTFGAVFRVRHILQKAINNFFDSRGFIMVHTPIITAQDCEGAGNMFKVTTLDLNNLPLSEGKVDFSHDFFEKETSLSVSGQLEGEIFAHAFKNIYTFGPTFRAENSHTARHASEFWMVEPEMAFCDLKGDQFVAEEFIKSIVKEVLDSCADEIEFFDQWIEKGLISKLNTVVNSKFESITYTEAIALLEKANQKFEYPVKWGADLQSEHERYITEKIFKKPVFVTDYPREIKAFYMRLNDDNKTVAAMDLLVPGVGEIIGGSQREERLPQLDSQMEFFGLSKDNYSWYRDLRRFGGVEHSGFGLGFERMLMYVTGMSNIRDVIAFPRTPGSAEF